MKDIDYLRKKFLENKIKFTIKSDIVKEAYLKNSNNELKAAKIMITQKLLPQSITHLYYSNYLVLQSLLFKCGIKCEDHNASIIILKIIFEIDNSKLKDLKKERIEVQYYLKTDINKIQINNFLKIAENFKIELENFIDKLNNEDINKYKYKLKKLINEISDK